MKLLFDCANNYIQNRDWKMLAMLKFCLCSMGVLIGLLISGKHKKPAAITAGGVFMVTYILLMVDFLNFAWGFFHTKEEIDE